MHRDTTQLARMMKALGNEHRLELYRKIADQQRVDFEDEPPGCVVRNIAQLFKLSQPTLSHHLKELANAGLITTERRGKLLVAHIEPDAIERVEAFFGRTRRAAQTPPPRTDSAAPTSDGLEEEARS